MRRSHLKASRKAVTILIIVLTLPLSVLVRTTNAMSGSSSTNNNNNKNNNNDIRGRKGWLIVDFDGTCTIQDTTPLLPHLTSLILKKEENHPERGESEGKLNKEQRREDFNKLESLYFDLYEKAKQKVFSEKEQEEGNMSLSEALDSLDDASNVVTHQVSSSGVLRGLISHPSSGDKTSERIAYHLDTDLHSKQTVALRRGCIQVLSNAITTTTTSSGSSEWKLGVLSINWCPPLIDAALLRHIRSYKKTTTTAMKKQKKMKVTKTEEEFKIWSNEVNHDGIVKLYVPGASAKMECIASLRQNNSFDLNEQQQQQQANDSDIINESVDLLLQQQQANNLPIIYIGDSSTDLLALLEADVGILFVPSSLLSDLELLSSLSSLKSSANSNVKREKAGLKKVPTVVQIAKHYGILLKPLSEYVSSMSISSFGDDGQEMIIGKRKKKTNEKIVWITDAWEDIGSFLDNFPCS